MLKRIARRMHYINDNKKENNMDYPNPNNIHPNPKLKQICFIKSTITNPNITVGEYTYFDDVEETANFEKTVTHHYDFIGDKLIIGKFCAIGRGVEFIMNGANHPMNSVTTYPFYIMGGDWAEHTPELTDLPLKGDTVVGHDVWIGQNSVIMPGVTIGNGAIIAANSVVVDDVPAYHIVGGNPAKTIRKRFEDDLIEYLHALKWWDWSDEDLKKHMPVLRSSDLDKIRRISFADKYSTTPEKSDTDNGEA